MLNCEVGQYVSDGLVFVGDISEKCLVKTCVCIMDMPGYDFIWLIYTSCFLIEVPSSDEAIQGC